jgi:hypothetical protein
MWGLCDERRAAAQNADTPLWQHASLDVRSLRRKLETGELARTAAVVTVQQP